MMIAALPKIAGRTVARTFEAMGVAEEEIVRARAPRDTFKLLVPPDGMLGFAPEVYRAHARELCERAARGEDLRPATDTEVMVALSVLSLEAPLVGTAAALYERLFRAILPRQARRLPGEPARELHQGAADELLATMRRKLAIGGRHA